MDDVRVAVHSAQPTRRMAERKDKPVCDLCMKIIQTDHPTAAIRGNGPRRPHFCAAV
jgi:hypothetical protein